MTTKAQEAEFAALMKRAIDAGYEAVKQLNVTPMIVTQRADLLDDSSPVIYRELVEDGVCGFAWVNVKPGTCAFAKWLKKKYGIKYKSYYGGIDYSIHDFNQSMQKKSAFAHAMAKVLSDAGIRAYAYDRLD